MITTLTGKNDYQARQELDRLVLEYTSTYGDLSLHRFDGDELEMAAVQDAVHAMPFLSPQTMVILSTISSRKDIHDALIQLIDTVPDTTDVIVFDPNLDKRTALYKVLSNKTVFNEFPELDERALTDWTMQKFEKLGGSIDRRLARVLVQRVGEDQWQLHHEIEKLVNYPDTLSETIINDVVEEHPRDTIFQLLDFTMQGRVTQALNSYKRLRQARLEPQYIMGMIAWQLHNLALVVYGEGLSSSDLSKQTKLSPYVIQKMKKLSDRISKQQLKAMQQLFIEADMKIKMASYDADLVTEQLVTRLAST